MHQLLNKNWWIPPFRFSLNVFHCSVNYTKDQPVRVCESQCWVLSLQSTTIAILHGMHWHWLDCVFPQSALMRFALFSQQTVIISLKCITWFEFCSGSAVYLLCGRSESLHIIQIHLMLLMFTRRCTNVLSLSTYGPSRWTGVWMGGGGETGKQERE